MIHRIALRVGGGGALDFWAARLEGEGIAVRARRDDALRFADPEGLGLELLVDDTGDEPLTAAAPDVPAEHALRGFAGVRAYSADPARARRCCATCSASSRRRRTDAAEWVSRGPRRGGFYGYDPRPRSAASAAPAPCTTSPGPSEDEDIEAWDERYVRAGRHTSGLVDRFYFRCVYSREPSGVLFEIATRGPGFAADEAPEELGRRLSLPPKLEHLREQIEASLTPLPDPRAAGRVP